MQTVQPAPNQLFCKPEAAETVTKSGLFIQEKAAEKPKIAEIINTGSAVKHFKQRDRVIYRAYATSELKLNGETYIIVSEEDILGTIVDV